MDFTELSPTDGELIASVVVVVAEFGVGTTNVVALLVPF